MRFSLNFSDHFPFIYLCPEYRVSCKMNKNCEGIKGETFQHMSFCNEHVTTFLSHSVACGSRKAEAMCLFKQAKDPINLSGCVCFSHRCRVHPYPISGSYTCKIKFHIFWFKIYAFLHLSPPREILLDPYIQHTYPELCLVLLTVTALCNHRFTNRIIESLNS